MQDSAIRNERLAVRHCAELILQQAHLQILVAVHMAWSSFSDSFVPATGVLCKVILGGDGQQKSVLDFYASLK